MLIEDKKVSQVSACLFQTNYNLYCNAISSFNTMENKYTQTIQTSIICYLNNNRINRKILNIIFSISIVYYYT